MNDAYKKILKNARSLFFVDSTVIEKYIKCRLKPQADEFSRVTSKHSLSAFYFSYWLDYLTIANLNKIDWDPHETMLALLLSQKMFRASGSSNDEPFSGSLEYIEYSALSEITNLIKSLNNDETTKHLPF